MNPLIACMLFLQLCILLTTAAPIPDSSEAALVSPIANDSSIPVFTFSHPAFDGMSLLVRNGTPTIIKTGRTRSSSSSGGGVTSFLVNSYYMLTSVLSTVLSSMSGLFSAPSSSSSTQPPKIPNYPNYPNYPYGNGYVLPAGQQQPQQQGNNGQYPPIQLPIPSYGLNGQVNVGPRNSDAENVNVDLIDA